MPDFKTIQHICPKCQKKIYIKYYWTGNGILRKYCEPCQRSMSRVNNVEYFNNDPMIIKHSLI